MRLYKHVTPKASTHKPVVRHWQEGFYNITNMSTIYYQFFGKIRLVYWTYSVGHKIWYLSKKLLTMIWQRVLYKLFWFLKLTRFIFTYYIVFLHLSVYKIFENIFFTISMCSDFYTINYELNKVLCCITLVQRQIWKSSKEERRFYCVSQKKRCLLLR